MSAEQPIATVMAPKPKRADARRNYDKLLQAARATFTQDGTSAPLEEIARRAEVGIGTLYRNFPTRQHLLEAVYLGEVEAISRSAAQLAGLPPWDALSAWLHDYAGFAATKRALADEMMAYVDNDADVFRASREAIMGAGNRLLDSAQAAGVVRTDTTFMDIARLVGGIAAMRGVEPDEVHRILDVALDGLRYTPPVA